MTDETLSVIPQSPLILLRVDVWAKVCTVLIERNVTHATMGIGRVDSLLPISPTVLVVTPSDLDGNTGDAEPIAIEVGVIPDPAAEDEPPPAPIMPPEKKIYMPGDPANE